MSIPNIWGEDEQYVEKLIILPIYFGVVLIVNERFNKKIKIKIKRKQNIARAIMIISVTMGASL
jgi:hypothetical protein